MTTTEFVLLCICTVGTLINGSALVVILIALNDRQRKP